MCKTRIYSILKSHINHSTNHHQGLSFLILVGEEYLFDHTRSQQTVRPLKMDNSSKCRQKKTRGGQSGRPFLHLYYILVTPCPPCLLVCLSEHHRPCPCRMLLCHELVIFIFISLPLPYPWVVNLFRLQYSRLHRKFIMSPNCFDVPPSHSLLLRYEWYHVRRQQGGPNDQHGMAAGQQLLCEWRRANGQ